MAPLTLQGQWQCEDAGISHGVTFWGEESQYSGDLGIRIHFHTDTPGELSMYPTSQEQCTFKTLKGIIYDTV